MRNELKRNFGEVEFTFIANEQNVAKINRFSRSKDDFCCFLHNTGNALSVRGLVRPEELELEDGNCKEDAAEINKYQLLANMNKCAADIAQSASKRLLIFNKITVYGMLVDYKPAKICKKLQVCVSLPEFA